MTAETLSQYVAILLSLIFAYVPGVESWYNALAGKQKAGVMALLLVVMSLVIFGLSCGAIVNVGITCDKQGLVALGSILLSALTANVGSYVLLVSPFKKNQPSATSTLLKVLAVFLIPLIALSVIAPMTAFADGPQPYQYAMIQCSGLGTVENVVYANQQFDTGYGFDHQLTTLGQWQASYIARVNEFASAVGCPQVLQDDNTPTGALTFWYKIYVPQYQRFSPFYAALKANQVK